MDAAFNPNTKQGSSDIVISDTTGGFVAARSFQIDNAADVLMAEAMATRDALWFGEHMGQIMRWLLRL